MSVIVYVVGAVVVALVLLVLLVNTRYGKVYSDAHVIELCEVLDRIRDHGCARAEWDDAEHPAQTVEETLADLRNAETSGGVRLRYTVTVPRANPERNRHYVSLSQADRLPAEALARFLVGLVVVRYGLTPATVTVARSQNLVTHMMWELAADEIHHHAAAHLPLPDRATMLELRRRASEAGRAVTLQRMTVRLPG